MSTLEVGKIVPATGTAITLGESGDTLTVPSGGNLTVASGATINITGATQTGFPSGLFSSYAIIADQKSDTTAGGTFTTGAWRTRDLQTEIADPDGIVSIATNQFTLAAGSYLIEWSAPALNVSKHQSRLYDVTGTAVVEIGSSEFTPSPVIHSGGNVQNRSFGSARVSPSGSNAYKIEHNCSITIATIGFGQAASLGGEQYTIVKIFKEA